MGFFFIYILIFILASIALSLFNLDFITSFSAAASAISNVGPGLGNDNWSFMQIIVPYQMEQSGYYLTMLVGRLELFTFLVILSVSFWKK